MAIIKAVSGKLFTRIYFCLVCFSIVGHYLSLALRQNPGFIAPVTSFFTLVVGVLACYFDFWVEGKLKAVTGTILVLALGTGSEISGILTSFPFGTYRYTSQWWPAIPLGDRGFFPFLLPFAWLMISGASAFAATVSRYTWLNALTASFIAAGLDLVMEGTLAGKMDYWRWIIRGPLPGHSPLSNSLSWLAIAFLASMVLYRSSPTPESRRGPIVVLCGQLVLMLSLRYP